MNIYLSDQKEKFSRHLDYLKGQPIIPYDIASLTEKTTIIEIDANKSLIDLQVLFDYKIFPNNIMTYLTQWEYENRAMKIGDTIVQQAFIPPFRNFSQKIIFGVRINQIFNEPTRVGFSYETIKGHVEKGVSTFTIETTNDKRIIFKIHTFSKPGNLLTELVGPIFSVPYQTFCTRQALNNVKQQLEG